MSEVCNEPNWKLNKYLSSYLGLWPYHSKFRKWLTYMFFGITSSSLIVPMAMGLGDESNADIVIAYETFVATVMIAGGFFQCTMLFIREHVVKHLYEKIMTDRQTISSEKELEILSTFYRQGGRLTILFMTSTITCYILFLILTYVPLLVDENLSKNYTKIFPYYSNIWIIDSRTRNFQLIVHASLGIFYGGYVYIAIVSMLIFSVKHMCGMYAIVSYRLNKLINFHGIMTLEKLVDEENIVESLYDIIHKHKKAIEGVRLIVRLFSRTFFLIEVNLLFALAMLIFDVQYNANNLRLSFRIFFIALILIIYAFYMNYAGEQIIQFSSKIYFTTFFIKWYLLPVKAQKILLMIILRASKPDSLSAGVISLSMQNFASIMKASWSLATVLLSTQQKNK